MAYTSPEVKDKYNRKTYAPKWTITSLDPEFANELANQLELDEMGKSSFIRYSGLFYILRSRNPQFKFEEYESYYKKGEEIAKKLIITKQKLNLYSIDIDEVNLLFNRAQEEIPSWLNQETALKAFMLGLYHQNLKNK